MYIKMWMVIGSKSFEFKKTGRCKTRVSDSRLTSFECSHYLLFYFNFIITTKCNLMVFESLNIKNDYYTSHFYGKNCMLIYLLSHFHTCFFHVYGKLIVLCNSPKIIKHTYTFHFPIESKNQWFLPIYFLYWFYIDCIYRMSGKIITTIKSRFLKSFGDENSNTK